MTEKEIYIVLPGPPKQNKNKNKSKQIPYLSFYCMYYH